ncbi:MAG: DEAD/DEAH box helicase [Candidatus Aenigmatarchaeota archaeon]
MTFEKLHPRIQELIEEKGWDSPTEPQRRAIGPVLGGEDILLTAQTGAGKTESVMLPLLHKILEEDPEPIALLYITPLRALNRDMFQRLLWWCRKLDIEVTIRHGDTSDYKRRKQAEFPEQIFVTTPETLQAIIPGSKMKEHLKNVDYVVVDEIHELVESKRGVQLSLGLERLKELCGKPQMVGLSATVGSPEEVSRFLSPQTEVISATGTSNFEVKVEMPESEPRDEKLAEDLFADKEATSRLRRVHDLIERSKSSLVFTNTRETSEVLSSRLNRLDKEYDHSIHHSSLSKGVRIENEDDFKQEEIKSLICTSSLELGIDIGQIDRVLQYGSPRQVKRLLQRIGRSGHRVEEKSRGKVIARNKDDVMESAVIAKRALEEKLEPTKFHKGALDVLANQIVGYCIDEYGLDWKEIYDLMGRSYFYENLSKQKFYEVLRFMSNLRYLWIDDKVKRSKKAWEYYYENLSTIPDVYNYQVVDTVQSQDVGQLDESFVAEYGEPGTTFIMKGRSWRILSIDEGKVLVEPVDEVDSAVPAWEGELIPVPRSIAEDVQDLRRKVKEWLEEMRKEGVMERIMEEYPVDGGAAKKIVEYVMKSREEIAGEGEMLLEKEGEFVVIHSCNGTLANQTLGKFLASVLMKEKGRSIAVKNDPYRVMVQGADLDLVKNVLEKTKPGDLEKILDDYIEKSQLFKWRFIHAAKRFGAVQKRAKWDQVNIKGIVDSYRDSPIHEEAKREVFQEKLDMEAAKKVVRRIHEGELELRECESGEIGQKGLSHKFQELMGPEKPQKEIFKAFKNRIKNTEMRLMCMGCGEYRVNKKVRNLPEDIKCSVCGSGRITVIKPYEEEKEEILEKMTEGKDLVEKEQKARNKMERIADYVLTYGRKFIKAMAGRGVGPETAIRILAQQKKDEDEFYEAILEKEKEYTRTKKYWSD